MLNSNQSLFQQMFWKEIVLFQQEFPTWECNVKMMQLDIQSWSRTKKRLRLLVLLAIRFRHHPKNSDFIRLRLGTWVPIPQPWSEGGSWLRKWRWGSKGAQFQWGSNHSEEQKNHNVASSFVNTVHLLLRGTKRVSIAAKMLEQWFSNRSHLAHLGRNS